MAKVTPEPQASTFPRIVTAVAGFDVARTHFTFSNVGGMTAFSITVDTIWSDGNRMDFETIGELRAGASLTRLAIVYPVVGNDPHWAFEFWTGSGEDFALPFTVRYTDINGLRMVTRNILKWDGHRAQLLPHDSLPEPVQAR